MRQTTKHKATNTSHLPRKANPTPKDGSRQMNGTRPSWAGSHPGTDKKFFPAAHAHAPAKARTGRAAPPPTLPSEHRYDVIPRAPASTKTHLGDACVEVISSGRAAAHLRATSHGMRGREIPERTTQTTHRAPRKRRRPHWAAGRVEHDRG